MNLYRATEQARMAGKLLPDIDMFVHCDDWPIVEPAVWNIVKTREHVEAEPMDRTDAANFFIIPDFNFFSWPEAFCQPWT
jgi:Glycosyl transferase family 90